MDGMRTPCRTAFGASLVLCVTACRTPSDSPSAPVASARAASVERTETADAVASPPSSSASAPSQTPAADLRPIAVQGLVAEPQPGRYQLEAYVVELQPCPVCERPLRCKPCLSDHIVVAEGSSAPPGTPTAMLRVTADQIQTLSIGVRYRFEVQVQPAVEGGRGVNYVEVLEHEVRE